MTDLLIRYGSLAAMTVLGAGLVISAAAGIPPWGGDQSPLVRFLVVLFGLSLPAFELALPWMRRRWPAAFPTRPKRWSRSALWGIFVLVAGALALPDWTVAAVTLAGTGAIYLLEAAAVRAAGGEAPETDRAETGWR